MCWMQKYLVFVGCVLCKLKTSLLCVFRKIKCGKVLKWFHDKNGNVIICLFCNESFGWNFVTFKIFFFMTNYDLCSVLVTLFDSFNSNNLPTKKRSFLNWQTNNLLGFHFEIFKKNTFTFDLFFVTYKTIVRWHRNAVLIVVVTELTIKSLKNTRTQNIKRNTNRT